MPRKRKNRRRQQKVAKNQGFASGMPLTRFAKLRYTEMVPINGSELGGLQEFQFRANNVHDPNVAIGGHQPMGYDQWTQLYNHYTVVGSKITIHAMSQRSNTDQPSVVGVYLGDDTAIPYADLEGFIESNKGTYKMLSQYPDHAKNLTCSFSAKRFFNLDDVKDNYSRIGAPVDEGPPEEAIYTIYHAPAFPGNPSLSANLVVTIEYAVIFSEPKDLLQS